MNYSAFIETKTQVGEAQGFDPVWLPDWLFDFQTALCDWAIRRGRAAIFADCGLGKSPMQLVWAENVVRHTGRPVLIATPLAVSYQLLREAEKFDIEAERSVDGRFSDDARIVITNYERLEYFDSANFAGMVCDESSILKNFSGVRRGVITEFLRTLPYRLLCTATAAPNDYTELGTSAEALGEIGYMDMLARFFKNDQNTPLAGQRGYTRWQKKGGGVGGWRFRGHAEQPFWRWVTSWARAVRRPSDLGFDDGVFVLPELRQELHVVKSNTLPDGALFPIPAVGLAEQREERRRTIGERCERVAELVRGDDKALVWCHLNAEGDLLAELIPDAVQVSGSDSDDRKERALLDFARGDLRVLVTKPKIGAWGLNLQRCAHVTFFPSHSYEQFYQGVRRCWRFGQDRPVQVDIVSTEGEAQVMTNLQRKADQADRMFAELVAHMGDALEIKMPNPFTKAEEVPAWL